jgi:hypothetical protein
MERIGLTANKSSAGVEGRSDLGMAEVGGVWRRWNRKILRLREGSTEETKMGRGRRLQRMGSGWHRRGMGSDRVVGAVRERCPEEDERRQPETRGGRSGTDPPRPDVTQRVWWE